MTKRSTTYHIAWLASSILSASAMADTPDTSEWVCEYCPFETGHTADFRMGVSNVSDDSAVLGDANGYDEEGVYANVDGDGRYTSDGYRIEWFVSDLGLDSRSVAIEAGRPGVYEFSVGWREIPRRQFDTTSTIFRTSSGGELQLPDGWLRAPQTSQFTALGTSLMPEDIKSDRRTLDLGGSYRLPGNFSVTAGLRRQERDGVKIVGGSTYTSVSLLPAPFDYSTDSVDLGLRYDAQNGFVSIDWYLSDFQSGLVATRWQQAFAFSAPLGTDTLALAQPPDNRFQQLMLSGAYSFPAYRTVVSATAAIGTIDQDAGFLAYTTNADLTPMSLPRGSLAGEVDTTNLSIALTARPVRKSRVNLSFRLDKRDNKTPQAQYERVISDSLLSGDPELNTPYSFERGKFKLGADYDLFDTLRLSGGYDRTDTDRDNQEVLSQSEDTGWGRVRWRPKSSLEIDARGGVSERDIDRYNEATAVLFEQNPLMRKYNLAYRYRRFGELRFSWSPSDLPLALSITGLQAEDEYTQSRLGLLAGDELSLAVDLSFAISETKSLFVNAGYEKLESLQAGSEQFAGEDWRAKNDDEFSLFGAGLRLRDLGDAVDLTFDYSRSDGQSHIRIDSQATGVDAFPGLETRFDFVRLALDWRRSESLSLGLGLRYTRFETADWSLKGVNPATIPVVLSLGAMPYDDDALVVELGFNYRLGTKNP
ncbi:MAG TPA: MtrB/PioB family decaheme-associated outer membrane protein [Woeseiaceae bacterium]|nr:MtrB/PioB family decaheme-associated outer membrane protein [Woeseiaceae bacterium]